MDKDTIFIVLMVGFILFVCYKLYYESDMFQLKCIVSTVDGDKYCVRERNNMLPAVDLLAKTSEKMTKPRFSNEGKVLSLSEVTGNKDWIALLFTVPEILERRPVASSATKVPWVLASPE